MKTRIIRKLKAWFYGRCPLVRGAFPYFGAKVYFPRDSLLFRLACEQGIYEATNTRILRSATKPNTWYFDVGANIGLMSLPALNSEPTLRVLSLEPSPGTYPHLARTAAESRFRDRWEVAQVAATDIAGELEFYCASPALGAFEGMRDTGRAGAMRKVRVPGTPLDALWDQRGRPPVSVIKIDVEGAETLVLRGARACIAATRPVILLEWTPENLKSYGVQAGELLRIADELGYHVHAMPHLGRTDNESLLRIQMRLNETFLLVPRE